MKANVGTIDRVLRVAAGLVLIGLAVSGKVGVWGYIGVVPLLTGLFRFCPVYPLIGLNTLTLPRFHAHQIVGNFLMNGGRDEQEGTGTASAVHR